jgi:Transmembrane family 220, helix
MRYANIVLGVLMLLFAAVQYNDPDAPLWMVMYLVPAAWAFMAAFRLGGTSSRDGVVLLWVSLAVYLFAVVFFWPQTPGFWRKDVWWTDEEAREAMGLMIAFGVLLCVLATTLRARSRRS